MIRNFSTADTPAITAIYNHYVLDTDISFETVPLTERQMGERLAGIAKAFPFLVDCSPEDGELRGYCYAHLWKERAAYASTWEATVYLDPRHVGKGIGTALMQSLIPLCREAGCHVLISCVTGGNEASYALHRKLGFTQASLFHEVGFKHGRRLDVVDYELLL